MFPFLIGRIRTIRKKGKKLKEEKNEFPFLIGRIRTKMITREENTTLMFPFLIGRIRTRYYA